MDLSAISGQLEEYIRRFPRVLWPQRRDVVKALRVALREGALTGPGRIVGKLAWEEYERRYERDRQSLDDKARQIEHVGGEEVPSTHGRSKYVCQTEAAIGARLLRPTTTLPQAMQPRESIFCFGLACATLPKARFPGILGYYLRDACTPVPERHFWALHSYECKLCWRKPLSR